MKLLVEQWREFVNEDGRTMDMEGNSWSQVEKDKKERAKQGAEENGFYLDGKLGSGQMGDVYLVENKKTGERNAMKHVVKRLYGGPKTSNQEAENYRFAMDNKASIPERFAKYLPDVYEVDETNKDYFIFMELLEDLPDRIKSDLFALGPDDSDLSRHEKYVRILKDPEAMYDIIVGAIYQNIILYQANAGVKQKISLEVPNKVIKRIIDNDEEIVRWGSEGGEPVINWVAMSVIADLIVEESMPYLEQDPILKHAATIASFRDSLVEDITHIIEKQIIPVHGGHGSNSPAGGSLKSIESNFPEAQDLIRAMKYFYNTTRWQPKDIHSQNVMRRPSTKSFVIT